MFEGELAMYDKINDYNQRKNCNKDKCNSIHNKEHMIEPSSTKYGIVKI